MRASNPLSIPAIRSTLVAALFCALPGGAGAGELPPHLACERALYRVLSFRGPLQDAAQRRDLDAYQKGLSEIAAVLVDARTQFESAVLTGAWKAPAARRAAFDLTARFDAAQTLRLMADSPLSGYKQFTGKVPPGTLDGTRRLLAYVEQLAAKVTALNEQVGGALPSGQRASLAPAHGAQAVPAAYVTSPAPAPAREAAPVSVEPAGGPHYALKVSGGFFHGPGRLPDSPLPPGLLGHIRFSTFLTGETSFFNNGSEPPNAPEPGLNGSNDGRLSDGTPFNEHVWGGIAEVGRGAMKFMVVVASTGPNRGTEKYTLQDDLNWRINTDLALDPGFPEGIVISKDIRITTGVVWVPRSVQTERGIEGGQDQAGSLPSGVPVVGRLGDYDADGFLDGSIVGASAVPITNLLAPGAPVVQRRDFASDIPVTPLEAAALTVGSIVNFDAIWSAAGRSDLPAAAKAYVLAHRSEYLRDVAERWAAAARLLEKAPQGDAALAGAKQEIGKQAAIAADLARWSKDGIRGDAPAEVEGKLKQMWSTATEVSKHLVPLTAIARR